MAELPTKGELEQVYHEKGHDALVWYAWRCSLRALPALGRLPLTEALHKNTVQNVFEVFRSTFILAQWTSIKCETAADSDTRIEIATLAANSITLATATAIESRRKAATVAAEARTKAATAAAEARVRNTDMLANGAYDDRDEVRALRTLAQTSARTSARARCINIAVNSSANAVIIANTAIATAANIESDIIIRNAMDTATKAAEVYMDNRDTVVVTVTTNVEEQLIKAARTDLELLKKQSCIDQFFWFSHNLWPKSILGDIQEPKEIKQHKISLLKEMKVLNLGFLAQDLKFLWDMKPLGCYIEGYFKKISKSDLNNPVALRYIILGNEVDKVHAVRTLIIGPGGAGKTSLADRLKGRPVESIKASTKGIEYLHHEPLDLQKAFPQSNLAGKKLNMYLWDFGGQTIFHGLHRSFIHENCVYILVVDSRHEQTPDEWLYQIRHMAGNTVTVLLVTNQHDGCDIRQNENRLLRKFGDLLTPESFHYFSCIDPHIPELQIFVDELVEASLNSQVFVWKETLNIYRAIQKYTKKNKTTFISVSKIKKIVEANKKVENSKLMINTLEQLGFLTQITKAKHSFCLKPEWAVDRAYELLYSDTLRNNKGKLDLLDFDECFAAAPTEEQQSKLLDFLGHRSLCFELPESGEYFFPDAATVDEPEVVAKLLKHKQRLQIRFDLPYIPLGFHTRLIKPLFNEEAGINNSQYIWRHGFIQQCDESHAVVQYLLRKSSIEITLVGNPQHYAHLLDKFYAASCLAIAEGKTGLQQFNIRPFIFLEKQLFELDRTETLQAFSVHSVVELVKVLQAANGDLKQVYEDVRDMAADKKGDTHHHYHKEVYQTDISGDGQTAVGSDHATMNQYLDKSHTEITADQRNQIAAIVGELLKDAGSLPAEQLVAVAETKKALEAPANDVEAQNLLGKAWTGLNEAADFTKNKAIPIADFAIKHKESLGAALVTAMTVL